MMCVSILYISGGAYSLKKTPNDRFFEKLFMANGHTHSRNTDAITAFVVWKQNIS